MCSVTFRKTGKQVNLGLLIVISPLFIRFYGWKFLHGDLSQAKFISPSRQFFEEDKSFMVIPSKMAKSGYFFPSPMFTFHSLVQLPLPTVKLHGVSQPISIEYKMGHGFSQAMFTT